jgi:CHAD domain-containing protein
MAQVHATPSMEHLHEWRKRMKDLGYQVRLLTPIGPGILEDLADELEQLADYFDRRSRPRYPASIGAPMGA